MSYLEELASHGLGPAEQADLARTIEEKTCDHDGKKPISWTWAIENCIPHAALLCLFECHGWPDCDHALAARIRSMETHESLQAMVDMIIERLGGLSGACAFLGWQGGTIHQARFEIERRYKQGKIPALLSQKS